MLLLLLRGDPSYSSELVCFVSFNTLLLNVVVMGAALLLVVAVAVAVVDVVIFCGLF